MKVIFTFNTHILACKATAEGFQGATGKPLGSILNEKKLLTPKDACPRGVKGARGFAPFKPLVKIGFQRHVR